jgi:hypothetical protein
VGSGCTQCNNRAKSGATPKLLGDHRNSEKIPWTKLA